MTSIGKSSSCLWKCVPGYNSELQIMEKNNKVGIPVRCIFKKYAVNNLALCFHRNVHHRLQAVMTWLYVRIRIYYLVFQTHVCSLAFVARDLTYWQVSAILSMIVVQSITQIPTQRPPSRQTCRIPALPSSPWMRMAESSLTLTLTSIIKQWRRLAYLGSSLNLSCTFISDTRHNVCVCTLQKTYYIFHLWNKR